jgi:cytochrome oxidase Cu insertion factor (SCO1/SenC/PrrC family)
MSLLRTRRLPLIFLLIVCVVALPSLAQGSKSAEKGNALPQPKYKVGDIAPDFTLKDQNGNDVSLHQFRGKKSVALAFYIFAFSGG